MQIWIGVGFAGAVVLFLMIAYFVPPKSPNTSQILRALVAIMAGAAGAFLTGGITLQIDGEISSGLKLGLTAAGGIALFVFVWITWDRVANTTAFHVTFPIATKFAAAAGLIGQAAQMQVQLSGFNPAETSATVVGTDLKARDPVSALRQLRDHFPPNSIRPYAVDAIAGGYQLKV